MAEDSTEHLGSSDCSSVRERRLAEEQRFLEAAYQDAVEERDKYKSALIRIMIWAEHDAISGETRQKAMADIAKACHEALED